MIISKSLVATSHLNFLLDSVVATNHLIFFPDFVVDNLTRIEVDI